jgi:hypothetical protein
MHLQNNKIFIFKANSNQRITCVSEYESSLYSLIKYDFNFLIPPSLVSLPNFLKFRNDKTFGPALTWNKKPERE